MTELALSVLEWQGGEEGKRNYEHYLLMKNFNYHGCPVVVIPNLRETGFTIRLRNKFGLNWQVNAEFYGQTVEARPGQEVDDIIYDFVREFPNVHAPEFHMPTQQPQIEHNPDLDIEQDFDQNGRIIPMSADINQNQIQNLPIGPPENGSMENNDLIELQPLENIQMENVSNEPQPVVEIPQENIVPIEPEPMPAVQRDIIVDNVLHYREGDPNVNLLYIPDDEIEDYNP